jgi:hypothetical protein
MADRRRTPRYVLDTPLRADAMPMEDVTIEEFSGDQLVVISPSAHESQEDVMIHMTTGQGLTSHTARVMSSRPVSVAGTLCFRVELRVAGGRPLSNRMDSREEI